MSNVSHIKVTEDDDGQRLDRWLKKTVPDIPYGLLQKIIRKGQLRIDGKRAKADTKLIAGQEVRIPPVEERPKFTPKKLSDEDINFIRSIVIHDDGEIIALNKPAGIAVQGGTKTRRHIDGLLDALKDKKGVRPRLVHRLDKDTSGILLLARSAKTAKAMGDAFKGRDIKKIYWAITNGVPEVHQGTIRAALAKAGGSNKERMVIDEENGKKSQTAYAVLEHAGKQAAFVAFWPRTGRTHQIRAHAEAIGIPILGDRKYRGEAEKIEGLGYDDGLHLHARRIIMKHPVRGGMLDIVAPLPHSLQKSWKAFGFNAKDKSDPFAELEA